MEDLLKVINDSEALAGIGYADIEKQETLLGKIMQLPKAQKAQALRKVLTAGIPQGGSANLTSRDKAIARIGGLPADVQKALANKSAQLVDAIFYVRKAAGGVSQIKMFKQDDDISTADGNIGKAKLEKDAWLLVTHVGLLEGVNATLGATAFANISAAVANGTFELKSNTKYLMPKDNSLRVFDSTNRNDVNRGMVELDSPKWLEPQTIITMDMVFPAALPANTNLEFVLKGQAVMPF